MIRISDTNFEVLPSLLKVSVHRFTKENYENRVDRSILRSMYIRDDKEFLKVVNGTKYNLNKYNVGPFVSTVILDENIKKQRETH